ncbi:MULTISPECIES: adenylate/guanylate cyclase domain-containing protein [Rhizobium]|uniref:Adenylate/guanylate cyclase domain-containing protein n=1 Tax=Rhizobium aouanii TaxID=3118145 RepID=A0ABU8CJ12_9HYPH|nr:adenylate/guanylate cyclase domain-containing protein [Rhizobium acaciae]MCW1410737.1 adenylate/guanylate cyclase domain-containing protein [Rhizobium acaciae]MCW1742964.1 adenylate/guanylate cyclase domain-containing protein [Rhizobium acaciae]MCW1750160.1 adenylate/guanylate cyclase domain-containing protein [Rhizobium acaciae]
MGLLKDLQDHATQTFREQWSTRDGQVVPSPTDLKLSNDAVQFDRATVLYADLTGSTNMVDTLGWQKAAEIYKSFLFCAGKIIREGNGVITSYDGDRVMGVFIGNRQTTNAAICGLKINWAVQSIINPALTKQYSGNTFAVSQVVGIDTSTVCAARTGVRGDNDIVWVGRAANYAAKLTEIKLAERTWLTEYAYTNLADEAKFGGNPKQDMWKRFTWTQHGNIPVYGSTYWWPISN